MLSRLITALHHANLDMTSEEIADTVWLALQMGTPHAHTKSVFTTDEQQHEALAQTPSNSQPPPPSSQPLSQPGTSLDVHLDSQQPHHERASTLAGFPFRSPAGSALPNALSLARALRPLLRRQPSKTTWVLNEHATVQRIAESQMRLLTPVLTPAPTHWFDVQLIVDVGASMLFWEKTIAELRALLEHHGAFRNVRIWRLATDHEDYVHLYAGIRASQEHESAHDPKELIDPGCRRLLLVVSDCVSAAWHSGSVQEIFDVWGQKNVVTLIQMLPRRLWPRTTLGSAEKVEIYSSWGGTANAHFKIWQPLEWFEEDTPTTYSLPFPTITLEPRSLSAWAQMITGTKNIWVAGVIFEHTLEATVNEPPTKKEGNNPLSPKKRVQLFRTSASMLARKLAGLLAAAPIPISLPVIRLVQHTMLPEASQLSIAEIFLGGLLEEIYRDTTRDNPDLVLYDFVAGVRDELINAVPIPDAHEVLKTVSAFVQRHYGQPGDFRALVRAPQGSEQGKSIEMGSRPFAHIEIASLRRFGGAFTSLVNEIERQMRLGDAQQDESTTHLALEQTILESLQPYSSFTPEVATASHPSFMSEKWCDFDWTGWLPLNSPMLPGQPGIYRVRAIGGHEIFYIGSTGRNLKERIGDLHRNIIRDTTQMPFRDPHTAAPALWAWKDADGIDFECSTTSLSSNDDLTMLVHYFLWQYRLAKGTSTVSNHGRFHPHYTKSGERKTGQRGHRLPDDQLNPDGGASFSPLPLLATPPETTWMGLLWSEPYPLRSSSAQSIATSPGLYKILDVDTAQLLFIGSSRHLKNIFQTQARKKWNCPHPVFAFSTLSEAILPHQMNEAENDLFGGYYAQKKEAPLFQIKSRQDDSEHISGSDG